MSFSPINFKSSRETDKKKDEIRKARETLLSKAESDFRKKERQEAEKKALGIDTWMLPSVNKRITDDQTELAKVKHKKTKKAKKEKKKKKHKKKKARDDSDSSSDSDGEDGKWVEKEVAPVSTTTLKAPVAPVQRDEWMTDPFSLIPTVTRQELRDREGKNKDREKNTVIDEIGTHERELNPFWKDGGTGLPEESVETKKNEADLLPSSVTVGDGGLLWLRKGYQRCVEQAKEEGRSLEDVAADRWGSLGKLKAMMKKAESIKGKQDEQRSHSSNTERRGGNYYKERHTDSNRYDSYSRRSQNKSSSKSPERKQRRSRSSPPRRANRDESDRRDYRHTDYDHDSNRRHTTSRYQRESYSGSLSNKSRSSRFMKPGEDNDSPRAYSSGEIRDEGVKKEANWRKKGFIKPTDDEAKEFISSVEYSKETVSESLTEKSRKTELVEQSPPSSKISEGYKQQKESSESDSSCDSEPPEEEQTAPPIVLTIQEMNSLAAKILRAEMMGDEALVSKLKGQMESARKAQEVAFVSASSSRNEDEVVVLTRTNRKGMARPLSEGEQHYNGASRKRKKQKVATHNKDGERERYFPDDDNKSLRSMVEYEKLHTADEQNQMFSKLAGRTKTDDDFQVDDIFMQNVTKKESASSQAQTERSRAIMEHRVVAAAMRKCHYCFENVSKHLIVSFGVKVYLSVPYHKSMAEAHCLIIPMQHTSSSTSIDEDVWAEIQEFKKCLVRLVESMDEDIVFMETSMNLGHHPHMCIECIPMPKETGDLAPIYFKKAIQESEGEWSDNKKIHDLKEGNIRKTVPKGFPYFAVQFSSDGGYAHVVEDERTFPRYFGREIVGGMLDLEPTLWRKPPRQSFEDQRQKVLKFAQLWNPFDWTKRLNQSNK